MSVWDKKAKSYDKGGFSQTQQNFLKFLDESGVSFDDKTLIDVGCGTGNYAVFLAKKAKFILGLDSSSGMLDEFRKKIKSQNFTNILLTHAQFCEFEISKFLPLKEMGISKFDIAFLTMSPAISSQSEFEKFLNLGNLRVYLNWEKPRNSSFINFLSSNLVPNFTPKPPISQNFMEFLDSKNLPFKTEILKEIRVSKRSLDEAFENALWHLKFKTDNIDKNRLKALIDEFSGGKNFIVDETRSEFRAVIV